jgi:hypothetical protein
VVSFAVGGFLLGPTPSNRRRKRSQTQFGYDGGAESVALCDSEECAANLGSRLREAMDNNFDSILDVLLFATDAAKGELEAERRAEVEPEARA